jgi:hypothetical protein
MNPLLKQQILEVRKMKDKMHIVLVPCNGIVRDCNKCAFKYNVRTNIVYVCKQANQTIEQKRINILEWLKENDTNIYSEE